MKLDFKRTLKVGFAFLGIMLFWEVYDFAIPLILGRTFGFNSSIRGLIMGLDNLLALFMLPLFGAISDKKKRGKWGRRTPFIVFGTIAAAFLVIVLGIIENVQLQQVLALGPENNAVLIEKFGLAPEFLVPIQKGAENYENYIVAVSNAQYAMANSLTKANPTIFIMFFGLLFLALVAMSIFRSPAVALMPDVTVKPLRSQANAIINLMGGAGGLIALILNKVLAGKTYISWLPLFISLGFLMIFFLGIYLLLVKENKFVGIMEEENAKWEIVDEEEESGTEKLSKEKLISLLLILGTVFLWFFGFNAVKTHLSVYATKFLGFTPGDVSIISMANMVGGAIAMIPVAILASKIGRKKSIIIGLAIALVAFVPCIFFTANTPKVFLGLSFIVAGFGLVVINVNTFPMVTELAKGSNVGKYTGFYYFASMSAQTITPALAGVFMDLKSYTLFIYALIFIALAIVTMSFVKFGDSKPIKTKNVNNMDKAE
ncbi:MAG: MFS transporter [Clostridia bacterium]